MNDEELRVMAGDAIGLNDVDMRFFDPLHSDSQSLLVASILKLNVYINVFTNRTEITKIDQNGQVHTLMIEPHDTHGDNVSLAMRSAILHSIPAARPFLESAVQNRMNLIDRSHKPPQSLKHGLRVGKVRVRETAVA
jgi:hypothetical protein